MKKNYPLLQRLLIFSFLFICSIGKAEDYKICEEHLVRVGAVKFQTGTFASGVCFISLHPFSPGADMKYRDFLIASDGLMMSFISFGSGDNSSSSGAREFYFPATDDFKKENFIVSVLPDNIIRIKMANGDTLDYHSEKLAPVRIGLGDIKLSMGLDPKERGGIEIVQYKKTFIDAGFQMGRSPTDNSNGKSLIRIVKKDSLVSDCQVRNYQIFTYVGGEAEFRRSESEIKNLLPKICR